MLSESNSLPQMGFDFFFVRSHMLVKTNSFLMQMSWNRFKRVKMCVGEKIVQQNCCVIVWKKKLQLKFNEKWITVAEK